jgi:hypothetical protein
MCATAAAALADAPAMPHSLLARPAATQWGVVAARLSIMSGSWMTSGQTHGRALSYATLVHHHRLHHRHRRHHLPGPRHHPAVQMCATAAALADAPAMPHSLLARPAATQWRVVAARLSILIDVGACWTACQTHGRALSYATLVHHHRLHHRHRRHHLPGPRHHHRLHHHPLHPLHPRLQLWWSPMKMALSAG